MFPFDRLVRAVDDLAGQGAIGDEVVAQIGAGTYEPRHIRFHRFLDAPEFERHVSSAASLIAHAGAGTIEMALARAKPLLVVPRIGKLGEHVNDHQFATARKFEQLGHVLAAYAVNEIKARIGQLCDFVPRPRLADRERLARRIASFMTEIQDRQAGRS